MLNDAHFTKARAAMLRGNCWDLAFDRLLPPLVRAKSSQFWSPLCVARRAALRFVEHGARRVLDVGAGPGKFCIAAALARPTLELCGIEQRPDLVEASRKLSARLEVPNVEFRVGNAVSVPWNEFDGFYFFNPFAENMLPAEETYDETVELSTYRMGWELLQVIDRLGSLRTGSVVVTYCGLGAPIPSSYDLASEEPIGSDCLRTWVKRRSYDAGWYHLDHQASRTGEVRSLGRTTLRLEAAAHRG